MRFQDTVIEPNCPYSKKIVIFNHIPKCGGSTLSNILHTVFPAHALVSNPGDTLRAATELDAFPDDIVLTTGHFVWGIEEALKVKRTPLYITLLREPFSLFRSFCTYQVKRYNTTVSLEEYLRTSYMHNPLCEFLGAGDGELAKRRLEEYAAFGILEEFGLSLALFAERLGFTAREYETRNVSNSQGVRVDASIEKEFRKHNAMDSDLYAWAAERFRRETRKTVAVTALTREGAPREVKRQHVPYLAEATRHIAEGRHRQALDLIEENNVQLDGMTLADLYKQAGDMAGYKRSLLSQWKGRYIPATDMAFGLMPLHPRAPERILRREIARYRELPRSAGDSRHSRYLVECHRCLGVVRQLQGRPHAEIVEAFEAGLDINRKIPNIAVNYARYLIQQGMHRRAMRVLAETPTHIMSLAARGDYYSLLGECHSRLGGHRLAQSSCAAAYQCQPTAERLSRYLGSLYGAGNLPELGRVLRSMVQSRIGDDGKERPDFESEMLVPWYMLLLMGWTTNDEVVRFEQTREELLLLCALAQPRLGHLGDDLLASFAEALLAAGRQADLMAILTIFLRSCSRSRGAGIQVLLGRLHLAAGRGGPAVDLFQEACAADPGRARDILRLARQAKENGSLTLAARIRAAVENGARAADSRGQEPDGAAQSRVQRG